jgi:hypothetical protein
VIIKEQQQIDVFSINNNVQHMIMDITRLIIRRWEICAQEGPTLKSATIFKPGILMRFRDQFAEQQIGLSDFSFGSLADIQAP